MFHKNIIRLLPDSVCSQISAGEVVQRPASVVKELLENSLDASAKEIKLIIEDGGKTLIQVIDDGIGMSAIDARMSLEKHATSKIHTAEDLYAIKTMGFRGEAIASIVAVAQCILTTRPKDINIGTKIIVEGSKVITQEPITTHVGTNFIVRNLFYNIPARRVFLKSAEIEMRHVVEEFRQIVLARNDVHFILISNKQEIYDLQPTTRINRIVDILGGFYRKKLLHCHDKSRFVSIDGFISDPSCNKKQHFLFVNNRFIKSPVLQKVIYDAYDNYMMKEKKICYILFLIVAPDKIDVNLQPAKTEVRFHDEELIAATLKSLVRKTITFTSNQEIDFNPENNIDLNLETLTTNSSTEEIFTDGNSIETLELDFSASKEENYIKQDYKKQADEKQIDKKQKYAGQFNEKQAEKKQDNKEQDYEGQDNKIQVNEREGNKRQVNVEQVDKKQDYEGQEDEKEEDKEQYDENQGDLLEESSSRMLFVRPNFILSTVRSGLLIVDYQRAQERILYEKEIDRLNGSSIVPQQLLFPIRISVDINTYNLLRNNNALLKHFGFDIEFIDSCHVLVLAAPTGLEEAYITTILDDIHEENIEHYLLHKIAVQQLRIHTINTNRTLNEYEMKEVIDQLFSCHEQRYSPTGEVIWTILKKDDIKKQIKIKNLKNSK
jgi:DNA mismatch repair protein MutL